MSSGRVGVVEPLAAGTSTTITASAVARVRLSRPLPHPGDSCAPGHGPLDRAEEIESDASRPNLSRRADSNYRATVLPQSRQRRTYSTRHRHTHSLGRTPPAPQCALDHVALPKLDPDDPPVTEARALTRVEPGLPITPLEGLDDLFDETLVVQGSQEQIALPRLEREAIAGYATRP